MGIVNLPDDEPANVLQLEPRNTNGRAPQPIAWLATPEIFAELPPTPWVARGLHVGPGRPALLAGYGASAKTLSAQSMALAVASGRPIWGFFEVSEPGRVLHLDYEQGEHATRRRYQRLALGHGIDTAELGDRLRLAPLPRAFLDGNNAIDVFAREFEGAQLAIIDSLRAAAPTLDENDSAMRSALDVLTHASSKTGCAVVLLHHAGKAQDRHADARQVARGSSAIFDAAGNVLVIAQGATKTDPRRVTQTKAPAEAEGGGIEDFRLAVEDVEVGDNPTGGVRVSYLAVERESVAEDADVQFERDAERIIATVRKHRNGSKNTIVAASGMRKTRALAVIDALTDQGRLVPLPGPRGSQLLGLGGGQ